MNIIIIGATSGIGKALFEKYAIEGNRVGIIGRRGHLLEKLCQQFPSHTLRAVADVTKPAEIDQAINMLNSELGHVDIAIVCSGIGEINPTLDYSVEQKTIDTNVTGWTFVVNKLYNLFEKQENGHLVAITSIGGLRGEPQAPAYNATKAYQINYMEALAKKAYKGGKHVCTTDVRPGLVDTAMAKGEGLFWVMSVDKVARQIYDAICKKKSKVYVTKRWHLLAIINKILPFAIYKRL